MRNVAVVGAGSWGTALAVHLGRVGHEVRLWARDPALVDDMASQRANVEYLPGIALPDSVSVTHDMRAALRDAELVVSAIPSHGCRDVLRSAAPHVAPRAVIVSATKGLETDTMLRMSQVIAQETGFSSYLPTGEGLFAFANTDDVVHAAEAMRADYGKQAAKARSIAEEYFDSAKVLPKLLQQVGA